MSQSFYPAEQQFFNYKLRITRFDWDMLCNAMQNANPFYTHKAQRAWYFNQWNRVAREFAIPFMRYSGPIDFSVMEKVERTIQIQEIEFEFTKRNKVMQEWCDKKQMSMCLASQKYVDYPAQVAEERMWISQQRDLGFIPR